MEILFCLGNVIVLRVEAFRVYINVLNLRIFQDYHRRRGALMVECVVGDCGIARVQRCGVWGWCWGVRVWGVGVRV